MLNLQYFTKKKNVDNPVMGVADLSVHLEFVSITRQQPGSSGKLN